MHYFPIEVGSRGFPGRSLRHALKYVRLSNRQIKKVSEEVSTLALRASYTIWLSRKNETVGQWTLKERPDDFIVTETVRQTTQRPTLK